MCEEPYNIWDAVFTNEQEANVIKETANQMEQFLLRSDYKDIRDNIFIPIGKKGKKEKEEVAITSTGFVFVAGGRVTGLAVKKEDWPKIIKEYRINPKTIQDIENNISLKLIY